ncbi:hypothetical protein Tdes44962_MAKER06350 [Teratosphaeria destructans]|uniref:Uncharacterized protein n=1 Tax=Teratosphaeria destructans TaxID=418781 RepID=A0A9W7VXP9_9PEZI|nr:hypothetical protein Tdes44962_MAKER06350 [Teratosphaeria destructans]
MADDRHGYRGPRIYGVPPPTPQRPQWAVPLEESDAPPQRIGSSQSSSIARGDASGSTEQSRTHDSGDHASLVQRRDQSSDETQARPATSLRNKTSVKNMAQQFQNTGAPLNASIARRVVDSPGRIVTSDIQIPESPEFSKKLNPDLLAWEKKYDDLSKENDDLNQKNDALNKRCEDMERVAKGFRDQLQKVKQENEEMIRMRWKPYGPTQGHSENQHPLPYDNLNPHQSRGLEQVMDGTSPASNYYSGGTTSSRSESQEKQPVPAANGQGASPTVNEKRRTQIKAPQDRLIVSVADLNLTTTEGKAGGQLKSPLPRETIVELRVSLHLLPAIAILSQKYPDKYSIENAHKTIREAMRLASASRKQNPAVSEALLGRCWFYLGVCRIARFILDGTNGRPEICFERAAAKATGVYPEAEKAEQWHAEWRQVMRDMQQRENSRPVSSASSATSFWNGIKRLSGLSWVDKMERRTSVMDEETELGSPREERHEGRPRPQGLGIFAGRIRGKALDEDRHRTPRPSGFERIPTFSTMAESTKSTEVSPTSATSQTSPKMTKPQRVPTYDSASSFNSQAPTPTDESFSPMPVDSEREQREKLMLGRQERWPIHDDSPVEAANASPHRTDVVDATDDQSKPDSSSPRSYDAGDDQIEIGRASGSISSIPSRRTQSMASIENGADRGPGINDADAIFPAPATDRFKRHKSTASYIPPSFAAAAGPSSGASGSASPRSLAKTTGSDTSPSSTASSSSLSGGGSTLLHRRKSSFSNALSPLRALAAGRSAGNTLDSLREAEEGQSPYRSTFGEEGLIQRMKGGWHSGLYGNQADGGESPGGGMGDQPSPRAGFRGLSGGDVAAGGSGEGGETSRPGHDRHGHSC